MNTERIYSEIESRAISEKSVNQNVKKPVIDALSTIGKKFAGKVINSRFTTAITTEVQARTAGNGYTINVFFDTEYNGAKCYNRLKISYRDPKGRYGDYYVYGIEFADESRRLDADKFSSLLERETVNLNNYNSELKRTLLESREYLGELEKLEQRLKFLFDNAPAMVKSRIAFSVIR